MFLPPVVLLVSLGLFLNVLNLLTLRTKKFRRNSCSFYFFCSSLFDCLYLFLSGSTLPWIDWPNLFFCRSRIYWVITCPTMSTCFLMFASIDRCLSSSAKKKWRNLSNLHLAHLLTAIFIPLIFLLNLHLFFFFQIEERHSFFRCVPQSGLYRRLIVVFLLFSNPFVVYFILFFCNLFTLTRLRRSRRRCRSLTRQWIVLIFLQVILGMILTFFRCSYLIFTLTGERKDFHSQLDQLTLFIYYCNFFKAFPLNLFSSSVYRHAFLRLFSSRNK